MQPQMKPFFGISSIMILLLLSACDNKSIIVNQLEEMMKHKVSIPYEKFVKVSNKKQECDNIKDFRILVYVDSLECSPCAIKSFIKWEEYLLSFSNLTATFIIETKPSQVKTFETIYHANSIENTIYLDTCHAFILQNNYMPSNAIYHTLLLNNEDSILLVGNPIVSPQITDLYLKILRDAPIMVTPAMPEGQENERELMTSKNPYPIDPMTIRR